MKILNTKTVNPKTALAGIKRVLKKAERAGQPKSRAGHLEKDTRYKLQLVAGELENLAALQEVMVNHYEKIKARRTSSVDKA